MSDKHFTKTGFTYFWHDILSPMFSEIKATITTYVDELAYRMTMSESSIEDLNLAISNVEKKQIRLNPIL